MEESTWEYLTSCRVALALLQSIGYAFVYILRVDLSVAIVCMVKEPYENDTDFIAFNGSDRLSTGQCGHVPDSKGSLVEGEFEWSKDLRGLVLGSFFYGYLLTQIPGGFLAARFGPKKVFGITMVINSIVTLLTPVAARFNVYLVIALRVLLGLCQGVCFPTTHHMWGRWAPPLERSKLVAFSYAGTIFGTVIALSLSGFLCELPYAGGWPLIFYIYGSACGLWCIAWFYAVHDTPAEHPKITDKERNLIMTSVGASVYRRSTRPPWKDIASSSAVWAIVVAHVCNNWGSYTVLTSIPIYMKEVLRFDIKRNGLLSAIPYMVMYVVSIFAGWLADWLRQRKGVRTVIVRKIWQSIAFLPSALCIASMGFMTCEQRNVSVILLTLTIACTAFGRSAYSVNHVDIAPRYSGTIISLSNTAATLPGFISPAVVALLTPNGNQSEWQRVFFISGAIYAVGGIVFLALCSGQEQHWAGAKETEQIDVDGDKEAAKETTEL